MVKTKSENTKKLGAKSLKLLWKIRTVKEFIVELFGSYSEDKVSNFFRDVYPLISNLVTVKHEVSENMTSYDRQKYEHMLRKLARAIIVKDILASNDKLLKSSRTSIYETTLRELNSVTVPDKTLQYIRSLKTFNEERNRLLSSIKNLPVMVTMLGSKTFVRTLKYYKSFKWAEKLSELREKYVGKRQFKISRGKVMFIENSKLISLWKHEQIKLCHPLLKEYLKFPNLTTPYIYQHMLIYFTQSLEEERQLTDIPELLGESYLESLRNISKTSILSDRINEWKGIRFKGVDATYESFLRELLAYAKQTELLTIKSRSLVCFENSIKSNPDIQQSILQDTYLKFG
jgi:hypothetical protein